MYKHHDSCHCDKCDKSDGDFKAYPVSKLPIYESISSMPVESGLRFQQPPVSTNSDKMNYSELQNKPQAMGMDQGVVPHNQQIGLHMGLQEVLNFVNAFDLEELCKKNPDTVNVKGFNGQGPLHKACLRGDKNIVAVLLKYGADVNARNDFEETPLHFACKRGNHLMVHYLIEHGANIKAVDKSGKGPMHHAAQCGSVYVMHYLSTVCGLDTQCVDNYLITPLHLICSMGHVDALRYVLRKDRVDIYKRDGEENLPLHIAAQQGHRWTCWKLLNKGGTEQLKCINKHGKTPLDLAKTGKQPKYVDIIKLLEFYSHEREARGPVLGWYMHILMPFICYTGCLIGSWYFEGSGLPMLLGLIYTLYVLYHHIHRMEHVSRWPNPIFAGTFASGLFFTFALYLYYIAPVILEWYQWCVYLSVFFTAYLLYVYYKLLTGDPGVCRDSARKPNGEIYTIADSAKGDISVTALCETCEIVPPKQTKHCKLCELCYTDMDHHCLYLYRCVAKYNHRLFVIFCGLTLFAQIMFMYQVILYVYITYTNIHLNLEFFWVIFSGAPWLWSSVILNIASIIWGIFLLKYQLLTVSKAHTTVHQPNSGMTNLTYWERWQNLVNFFAGKPPKYLDSFQVV